VLLCIKTSNHKTLNHKRQWTIFLFYCDAAPFLTYLKILHFPDSKSQTLFNTDWTCITSAICHLFFVWHWVIKHSACLQWLVLLHGNESGWPDPDCLDPAGSGAPLAKAAICKQIGGGHDFTYRLFVRW